MICLSRTRCCVVFVLVVQPLIRMPLARRSEEHTSELQSPCNLVCRLLLEKKKSHHVRTTSTRLLTLSCLSILRAASICSASLSVAGLPGACLSEGRNWDSPSSWSRRRPHS